MFEKEAEEYVRKIRHDVINWDGAESQDITRLMNDSSKQKIFLQDL